jgi:hypothetical protein
MEATSYRLGAEATLRWALERVSHEPGGIHARRDEVSNQLRANHCSTYRPGYHVGNKGSNPVGTPLILLSF